jgi:predicted DNA binding protein
MKQTAVEWLVAELWECKKTKSNWKILENQAKEMEKQQIIEFTWTHSDISLADIEKEFNETFNQKQ